MPLKRPATTPVPDEIFDEWLPVLDAAELRVLLYIVRRTFGFDKRSGDTSSYKQFLAGITTRDGRVLDRGCRVKNCTNLSRALQKLEARGLIRRIPRRALEAFIETRSVEQAGYAPHAAVPRHAEEAAS